MNYPAAKLPRLSSSREIVSDRFSPQSSPIEEFHDLDQSLSKSRELYKFLWGGAEYGAVEY